MVALRNELHCGHPVEFRRRVARPLGERRVPSPKTAVGIEQIKRVVKRFQALFDKAAFGFEVGRLLFAVADIPDLRDDVRLAVNFGACKPYPHWDALAVRAFDHPLKRLGFASGGSLYPRFGDGLGVPLIGRAVIGDRQLPELGLRVAVQLFESVVDPPDCPRLRIVEHDPDLQIVEDACNGLFHPLSIGECEYKHLGYQVCIRPLDRLKWSLTDIQDANS